MLRINPAAIIALVVLGSSPLLHSQAVSSMRNAPDSRGTVALGYDFTHANAPPGGTQKFNLNGGFASIGYNWKYWLGVAAEAAVTHANSIGPLGQDLTLATYTAGPRVTARQGRVLEFAQATFGVAHGSDSYFPTSTGSTASANSFAVTAGGGIDIALSRAFAVRAIEAQYLHTSLPNGGNNSQNQLMLGAGIVFKFKGYSEHVTPVAAPVHKHISLTCSASVRSVQPGETVEVNCMSKQNDGEDANYNWRSSGGRLSPNGNLASVDTTGLTPGRYRIVVDASLASDPSVRTTSEVPFRVVEAPKAPVAPPPPPPPPPQEHAADREFHMNVRDILFDYDKSDLRPDSEQPLLDAASYLKAHPDLRILIGGYSDERGSTEYNIALGLKRANKVRDALVHTGISPDRLQVVSYGKGAQVCLAKDESCFQRNRRAAFLIQP